MATLHQNINSVQLLLVNLFLDIEIVIHSISVLNSEMADLEAVSILYLCEFFASTIYNFFRALN